MMFSKGFQYLNVIALYLVLTASLCTLQAGGETYIVGDSDGWDNFDYQRSSWLEEKTFFVGDFLVFNYDPSSHNVMQVNQTAFEACMTDTYTAVLASGSDVVVLSKPGEVWFICGSHCGKGQKLPISVKGIDRW